MPARQRDGQEVAAARVLAVQQRAVRQARLEGHLKLHEGEILPGGLRPGGAGVGPKRRVEARQRQEEACGVSERGDNDPKLNDGATRLNDQ